MDSSRGFTRRTGLRATAGLVAGAALSSSSPLLSSAAAAGLRGPESLPDPGRPAGEPTDALPFDHIVIVMMENHSFDNYLGMLPRRGGSAAIDGFSFDAPGNPTNSNPVNGGYITVQRAPSLCQPSGPSQGWTTTHKQIDGGRMDGFGRGASACMLYWDEQDIPFYHSLARSFTVGNRWFCSAPCQTYPNRRFMLAGTAFGLISTDVASVTQSPPNGTIFDRLAAYNISWRDYYSDVPAVAVIEPIVTKYPSNIVPVGQFFADCAAGTLPSVSFVDSDIGVAGVVGDNVIGAVPAPFAAETGHQVTAQGSGSEEGPGDITLGETFVAGVVNAVLSSPAWPRTLLLWTYDEHGGYYDHVPPPAAIPPDSIKPQLGPDDSPGGYDIYGPRVPAVVVSPYSKPGGVSNTVCDHTSILATIQAKWNLPAMTMRDANANTMADFLTAKPSLLEPPSLAGAHDLAQSEANCSRAEPVFKVHPGAPPQIPSATIVDAAQHLVVRFYGRRHPLRGVLIVLYTTRGKLDHLAIELLRGRHVIAEASVAHLGTARHRVVLKHPLGSHLPPGRYTLRVRRAARTLISRRVHVG
jgi:phospholipase C